MYQFLMGLNDEISGIVRSNNIQEEPLPKLKKKMLARICKEEQYWNIARISIIEEKEALPWPLRLRQGQSHHLEKDPCIIIAINQDMKLIWHGYPEWWAEKSKLNINGPGHSKGSGRINAARRRGHQLGAGRAVL